MPPKVKQEAFYFNEIAPAPEVSSLRPDRIQDFSPRNRPENPPHIDNSAPPRVFATAAGNMVRAPSNSHLNFNTISKMQLTIFIILNQSLSPQGFDIIEYE